MRFILAAATLSTLLVHDASLAPASAQAGRGSLDFGVLETGVLPGGAEIPDLAGDTVDPGVEARQPGRAQAMPPPDDLFETEPKTPVKKRR